MILLLGAKSIKWSQSIERVAVRHMQRTAIQAIEFKCDGQ